MAIDAEKSAILQKMQETVAASLERRNGLVNAYIGGRVKNLVGWMSEQAEKYWGKTEPGTENQGDE